MATIFEQDEALAADEIMAESMRTTSSVAHANEESLDIKLSEDLIDVDEAHP